MRNGPDGSEMAQGFLVDFKSGKITKTFSSKKSLNPTPNIYASPDGKTIYYDQDVIGQSPDLDQDPTSSSFDRIQRLTGIYRFLPDETLQAQIENYRQGKPENP